MVAVAYLGLYEWGRVPKMRGTVGPPPTGEGSGQNAVPLPKISFYFGFKMGHCCSKFLYIQAKWGHCPVPLP